MAATPIAAITLLGNYISDAYLASNAGTASKASHYTFFNQGAGLAGLPFTTGDYFSLCPGRVEGYPPAEPYPGHSLGV